MTNKPLIISAALLALASCGSDSGAAPRVFRITAISDHTPDQLLEENTALVGWLEKLVGVKVEYVPVEKYSGAVTAIATGQADLAWLGGVTTVQAIEQSAGAVTTLVTRESDLRFKSYILVAADSDAKDLSDLKGKRFAFGSKSSTSGHIMPRHLMGTEKGIADPESFFGANNITYTGSHPLTVDQVADKTVDAGAVNYITYDERTPPDVKSKTRILWTTPHYVDYAWNVREDIETRFGAGTIARLRDAFVALDAKQPEDKKILDSKNAVKYVAVDESRWDGIKAVLAKIKLD